MAKFKIIIEKGGQILQSPNGERINRIQNTHIIQDCRDDARCVVKLIVNFKNVKNDEFPPCNYDAETKVLTTPGGEVLPVQILDYDGNQYIERLTFFCLAEMPYETNHRDHA